MIAFAKPQSRKKSVLAWHGKFLEMLPQIYEQALFAFRSAKPEAQEELVAEVVANAFVAFARLVERGKANLAYPTPLARFAICQVRAGRCVGAELNVRDVSSRYAQNAKGIELERLDRYCKRDSQWREILVEDRKAGPADTAAARIDVAAWFRSLTRAQRKIAWALARGESTAAVARNSNLSPGRISQLRQEFRQSWEVFQGEAAYA